MTFATLLGECIGTVVGCAVKSKEGNMENLVKFMDLSKGDQFLVDSEVCEVRAVDMPGDGVVHVWAINSKGEYETFHRRFEEMAVCPVIGG